jgi:hypothetical protein
VPEEIDEEGPVEVIPEQEALMPHEVVLADVEPMMLQLCRYHALMRDYEENPLRLEDDFDDLDFDRVKTTRTWMSSFPMMNAMIEIESLSLSLKIRIKNKVLGFA